MPNDYPEKRRFPRIPSELTVLVKKLGPDVLEEFAKTRVVGLGGCMFVSDTALGVGSPVELLISVRGRVLAAQGKIAWETPKGESAYDVGVEFMRLSPEDQQLLLTLFPAQGVSQGN
jgi:PilZ domain